MVLITLAELTLKLGWYTSLGLYKVGHRLIYGPTKTKEEILDDRIKSEDEAISKLNHDIEELQKLKDDLQKLVEESKKDHLKDHCQNNNLDSNNNNEKIVEESKKDNNHVNNNEKIIEESKKDHLKDSY